MICDQFPISAKRLPRSACPNAWHRAARRRKSATASPAPGFMTPWRRTFSRPVRSSAASRRLICSCSPRARWGRACAMPRHRGQSSGVTAAVAAGMTVLGFHGGSHCRPGHGDMLRAAGAARDIRRYAPIARSDRANRRLIRPVIPDSGVDAAHRPEMAAISLDFPRFSLYLTPCAAMAPPPHSIQVP